LLLVALTHPILLYPSAPIQDTKLCESELCISPSWVNFSLYTKFLIFLFAWKCLTICVVVVSRWWYWLDGYKVNLEIDFDFEMPFFSECFSNNLSLSWQIINIQQNIQNKDLTQTFNFIYLYKWFAVFIINLSKRTWTKKYKLVTSLNSRVNIKLK
jgi:hypothetical protein